MTFPSAHIVGAVPLKAGERPDLKRAATVARGHARIEPPRLAVCTKLPPLLDNNWPGNIAICRIERIREHKTYRSRVVVYAITTAYPPTRLLRTACLNFPATIGRSRTVCSTPAT